MRLVPQPANANEQFQSPTITVHIVIVDRYDQRSRGHNSSSISYIPNVLALSQT